MFCFGVHTVESMNWLRVLRVKVGHNFSDITLAYWWSCKDLVRGHSRLGNLVYLCSWRVQPGWCLRWLFQMEATIHLCSSLSRTQFLLEMLEPLYTISQILVALRWANIAFLCLISSWSWYQDKAVTSCHLSIFTRNDQIRQVSCSFWCTFWNLKNFWHIFWNQHPD